jgi:hypothetical protein
MNDYENSPTAAAEEHAAEDYGKEKKKGKVSTLDNFKRLKYTVRICFPLCSVDFICPPGHLAHPHFPDYSTDRLPPTIHSAHKTQLPT